MKRILIVSLLLLFTMSVMSVPSFAADSTGASPAVSTAKPDFVVTETKMIYDNGYYVLVSVKNNGAAVTSTAGPLVVSLTMAGKAVLVGSITSTYYAKGYTGIVKIGPISGISETKTMECPEDEIGCISSLTEHSVTFSCPQGYEKIAGWGTGSGNNWSWKSTSRGCTSSESSNNSGYPGCAVRCQKPGDKSIASIVAVDAWNKFSESNEKNNSTKRSLTIPDKRPDFVVTNLRIAGEDNNTLYATIKNIGGNATSSVGSASPAPLNVAAYIAGKKTINTLVSESKYVYGYTKEVKIGSITDIARKASTLNCPGSVGCIDKPIRSGYSHYCPAGTVLKTASGTGSGNNWSWKKISNGCMATAAENNIGGANCAITCERPADNVLNISAVVDAGSAFYESNEKNNILRRGVKVPKPDFSVIDIFATETTDGKSISAKIINSGENFNGVQYPMSVSVQASILGTKTYTLSSKELNWTKGEVKTVDLGRFSELSIASSSVRFTVKVDSGNVVSEYNEGNNSYSKTVSLNPDFTVSKIWLRYKRQRWIFPVLRRAKNIGAGVAALDLKTDGTGRPMQP